MNPRSTSGIVALLIVTIGPLLSNAADVPSFIRDQDVIYGRKYGTALTMDVFAPKRQANGAAVVLVVSGGWFSSHEAVQPAVGGELLRRGYTVFAVVHGSQPKYAIPEIIDDMHRAVRFIRYHSERFDIDPQRIGITGGSAGGHLSLMVGTAGAPGKADAKNPVDRASSRVQAVACFFPPTDFMNYGRVNRDVFQALEEELSAFKAPFDFHELDKETKRFVLIRDENRRREIAREISPMTHVTPDDPPTLIIHGDADKLVPIQQAETLRSKCEKTGVTAKLVVKPGAGHGWPDLLKDMTIIADWFDTHLQKPVSQTRPG